MQSLPKVATYQDDLATRAKQVRYRNIGSPYAFLNAIGLDPLLEEIYKGTNIVDVAKKINIGIGVLLTWLENEGHMQKVEDATKFSAEGYLSEASSLLREAQTDFQLKKAKEIASHGRFMASKLDKSKYGGDTKQIGNATGLTFIMHLGQGNNTAIQMNMVPETQARPAEIQAMEGSFAILPRPTPTSAREPDAIGPFEPVPFEPEEKSIPLYLRQADVVHEDGA